MDTGERSPVPAVGEVAAPANWRSLRFLAVSRILIATVLVLLGTLDAAGPFSGMLDDRGGFVRTAVAYFVVASALLPLAFVRRRPQAQLVVQVFADLCALALMMHTAGGARSGVGVVVVAAVASAAALSTHRLAAFFAATATLLLLGEAGWRVLTVEPSDPGVFVSAGMIGAACFLTAELVNRLATRLSAQQALALQRGKDLSRQLAVTELVMTQLPQGVVVLDEHGKVHAMNRSAERMLDGMRAKGALERLAGRLLADGDAAAVSQAPVSEHALVVSAAELGLIRPGAGDLRTADRSPTDGPEGRSAHQGGAAFGARRFRLRLLGSGRAARAAAILVVEDLREVEDRAQQLKLASMGRLSASIAHEIRNPLSAIRHANALLGERLDEPGTQRLARIVEDNTLRIDRIVRDVLSVARRDPTSLERIDLSRFLDELLPELRAMAGGDAERIQCVVEASEPMPFDADQLRQVLVNLVGNAVRYASHAPGAVRVAWRKRADAGLELRVSDDGPGLDGDIIEHAFEPFFTTGTQGTGLGLYLAREICAGNRAELRYEPAAPGTRSAFVIVPLPAASSAPAA